MLNKKDILHKILHSEAFTNSQVYQELLTYLFEASIQNITPKEYTIANEVFHKGANFDPSHDTIVRVYVYNLRKKLEHYYSHEGIFDEFRVVLPKGHYEIQFVHREKTRRMFTVRRLIRNLLVSILIGANVLLIYQTFFKSSASREATTFRKSRIWGDFLSNGVEKNIVLGDHFFFVKDDNDLDRRILLRKDDINTAAEFDTFKLAQPDGQRYVMLRFPMFPRNSVWPFADIISLFLKTDQTYKLNYASNVNAQDIKNEDILFVGSFHTLAAFDQTFRKSKYSYRVYPNNLTYHDSSMDTTITYIADQNPVFSHTDYGLVRKVPGPNDNIVFIFTSFHETGTIGIMKYFTDADSLKRLEKIFTDKLGHVPAYFEILFKANGYDRTVYTTEIIEVHEISPGDNFW